MTRCLPVCQVPTFTSHHFSSLRDIFSVLPEIPTHVTVNFDNIIIIIIYYLSNHRDNEQEFVYFVPQGRQDRAGMTSDHL